MFSELPLDDQIGKTFYINDALWRLAYNRTLGRFALRRVNGEITLERAVELITSGELLWDPLEYFESPTTETSVASVQKYVALLTAFLHSPFGTEMSDWALRARLDARLTVYRTWLTRRALKAGDSSDSLGRGTE
jgi:hypothetical protein